MDTIEEWKARNTVCKEQKTKIMKKSNLDGGTSVGFTNANSVETDFTNRKIMAEQDIKYRVNLPNILTIEERLEVWDKYEQDEMWQEVFDIVNSPLDNEQLKSKFTLNRKP